MTSISAQHVCGNIASTIDVDRLLSNKKAVENGISVRSNNTIYVPITFHIVSDANGDGGIDEDLVAAQLCRLNQDFEPLDMVFYLKNQTFNYVNHNSLFTSPTSASGGARMSIEKGSAGTNSVNIFITQNAQTGGLGTTLGYYDPSLDVIVIRRDQINSTTLVLAHEIGHFFSLLHVFNGWDAQAWDANIHGNPVNSQFSPGGVRNELADGSNCNISGDFICDTEADYNLGFGWAGCTEYGGGCQDFNGEDLDPEESNFMSYFIGCQQYIFSETQQDIVLADYNSPGRAFLNVGVVPNTGELSEPVITGPEDGATLSTFNDLTLDWEDVPNAVGYVVGVKRLLTEQKFFVTESYLNPGELESGKRYTWRVMPVSEIGGCVGFSDPLEFTTGTVSSSTEFELKGINLRNTLVNSGQVFIESEENRNVNINLYNVSGQLMQHTNQSISQGVNTIDLLNGLTTGMYFLNIADSDNLSKTFKIVVSN